MVVEGNGDRNSTFILRMVIRDVDEYKWRMVFESTRVP